MRNIKEEIETIFENTSASKTIFASLNRKLHMIIYMISALAPLPVIAFTFSPTHLFLYPVAIIIWYITWLALCAAILFHRMNEFAKKALKKMKIEPPRGILQLWINKDYLAARLESFYEALLDKNLLFRTNSDLELLRSYQQCFKDESKSGIKPESFVLGTVFLSVCLPVWSGYINALFKKNDQHSLLILVICLSISLAIFAVYAALYYANKYYHAEFINKKGMKHRAISNAIETIRQNKDLEYQGYKH